MSSYKEIKAGNLYKESGTLLFDAATVFRNYTDENLARLYGEERRLHDLMSTFKSSDFKDYVMYTHPFHNELQVNIRRVKNKYANIMDPVLEVFASKLKEADTVHRVWIANNTCGFAIAVSDMDERFTNKYLTAATVKYHEWRKHTPFFEHVEVIKNEKGDQIREHSKNNVPKHLPS